MRRRKLGRVMISNINLIVTTNPQDGSFRWRISNILRGPERKMLGKFCSFLGFAPRWKSCGNSWCLYSFMNQRLWCFSEKNFNFLKKEESLDLSWRQRHCAWRPVKEIITFGHLTRNRGGMDIGVGSLTVFVESELFLCGLGSWGFSWPGLWR